MQDGVKIVAKNRRARHDYHVVDSIEAASRTVDHPERDQFEQLIQRIVFTKLQQGQLDDCGLDLNELRVITSSMTDTLVNMYHHRIDYPGFDFNRRQQAGDSGPHQVGTKTVSARG